MMMDEDLELLRKELAEIKAASDAYAAEESEFTAEAKRLRDQANFAIEQANIRKKALFDKRRELRLAEQKISTAERRIAQAEENKRAEEELNRLAYELEQLTKDAPWRERALDHQLIGAKRMAIAGRGILADRPGLGKTLTSLMTADMVAARKVVVVVPSELASNFQREVQKWTDRHAVSIVGLNKQDRDFMLDLILPGLDDWVLIVAYSSWRRDKSIIKKIQDMKPDFVIADEAHSIKSRETVSFRGLRDLINERKVCDNCGTPVASYVPGIVNAPCCVEPNHVAETKNVLLMTGTPLVNKPQDLFSLLTVIDPNTYVKEKDFLNSYCRQDPYTSKWFFNQGGLDNLIKSLSSRFVARTREDAGIKIPPQEIQIHEYDFDAEKYPNQAKVIDAMRQNAMLILDQKDEFGEQRILPLQYILQLITRQRQGLVWPDGIEFKDPDSGAVVMRADAKGESMKVDLAYDLITDLVAEGDRMPDGKFAGERVVLFSQFKPPLKELRRRLNAAGISCVVFDGDTPDDLKERIKFDADRTNDSHEFQVILANYRVGGVGLNMTAFTEMIILDDAWNPANRDQAFGRIDRMGQTEETTVHILRINKSIDTWMHSIMTQKEEMISGLESELNLAAAMLDALIAGEM
jgi:SWI/SNF-related matrix-associated actin-dependent regulator 1 of chromatin subfamily A